MTDDNSMAVTQSKSRGKGSALTFASELAKEGLSAVVPGGGLMYEGVKVLVKHGMQFYQDRKDARIESFHDAILSPLGDETLEGVLNKEFCLADYTLLLSHAIQDEEEEKVEIYSRIFKALQNDLIPPSFKLHILKSSRDLSRSDFGLMREIFIASTYEFKDEGDRDRQVKERTTSMDPMKNLSIQNLIRLGYLYEKGSDQPPYPTELLKTLVCAIHQGDELKPQTIGKQTWLGQIYLGCFDLDNYSDLFLRITTNLERHHIRTVMAVPNEKSGISFGFSSLVVLFINKETQTAVEEYKQRNLKDNKKVVKVYLQGSDPSQEGDDLSFVFESVDETSINIFVDYLVQNMK